LYYEPGGVVNPWTVLQIVRHSSVGGGVLVVMTSAERDRNDAIVTARDAASHAHVIIDRVFGTAGGFVGQVQGDDFADTDVTAQGARDLADLLSAVAEHARHFRELFGSLASGSEPTISTGTGSSTGLPLNRKEQYYTATVLPMIIASDGFAYLHRFLDLCGVHVGRFDDYGRGGMQEFQFFTEYNLAESLKGDDRRRFPDPRPGHDTPDLVLAGPDWLLAVEAKMFHDPDSQALNAQLARQRVVIDYIAGALNIPPDRVRHVFLLPKELKAPGLDPNVVVYWESVVEAYKVVGPTYWVRILIEALDRYDKLRSQSSIYGANKDADLTGGEILADHHSAAPTYAYMGRNRGLDGPELANDIDTGGWRTRRYEVRRDPLEASNWFPVADFVALVDQL